MAGIRHQKGSVEKIGAKEKTWRGHYYVYDEAGKRHHRTANLGPAKDKKKHEAETTLQVIINRETNQPIHSSGQDTIELFWTNVYVPLKKGGWSKRFAAHLNGLMKNHVFPKVGALKLNSSTLDLRLKLQTTFDGLQHYSSDLNTRLKTYLDSMFEEAIEQEMAGKNPMKKVTVLSRAKRVKRFLTEDEIMRFLDQLKPRDRLICVVAIVLGCRPAELFALEWKNFDPINRRILINKTFRGGEWAGVKTAGSEAWMTIPLMLVEELKRWKEIQRPGEFIFASREHTKRTRPLSYEGYLTGIIRPAAIRAGIMQPRPAGLPKGTVWVKKEEAVNFQVFRRSCATWLEREHNPKAAQSVLRHTNPNTTAKHYVAEVDGNAAEGQELVYAKFFARENIFPPVVDGGLLTM